MRWSDIPRDPDARILRQFAGLWLIFFGAIAWFQGFAKDRMTLGVILVAVAVAIGILGLIKPSSVKWLFVGWMVLVFPIGWTVSHLILAIVFYVVVTPIALCFRLKGRDALQLQPGTSDSYWTAKPQVTDLRSYFRQF